MTGSERLYVVTGGLGAIATAATIQMLQQDSASKAALLHPEFESNRIPEVMKQYPSELQSRVKTFICDVADAESVKSAFEAIRKEYPRNPVEGPLNAPNDSADVLLQTAGNINLCPMEDITLNDWNMHMSINLTGPFLIAQQFAKWYLEVKRPARIITISTQAAHVALLHHGAYCAAKSGLNGLIRCQAMEWGKHGITSNTISPTVVMTPLGVKAWSGGKGEEFIKKIPNQRFAEPFEVANAIKMLANDGGAINGSDIRIDCGYTAT